jgi:hypothetical protein
MGIHVVLLEPDRLKEKHLSPKVFSKLRGRNSPLPLSDMSNNCEVNSFSKLELAVSSEYPLIRKKSLFLTPYDLKKIS